MSILGLGLGLNLEWDGKEWVIENKKIPHEEKNFFSKNKKKNGIKKSYN